MVLKPILGYFLIKRKTRVFPLFMGLYELFTTTLLILLATATWLVFLDFCELPIAFCGSFGLLNTLGTNLRQHPGIYYQGI